MSSKAARKAKRAAGIARDEPSTQSKELVAQVIRQEFSQVTWTGPIPPPGALREINEIIPGGADRVLRMAELQSAHRREMESQNLKNDDARSSKGMNRAFILTLSIASMGALLVGLGHDHAGATIAAIPTAGLITAFIYGRHSQKQERQDRMKIMLGGK